MLSSRSLGMAARQSVCASLGSRSMASAALGQPLRYQVSDASGLKIASKDDGNPISSLSVVVRAGSRYDTVPGVAHALRRFAFSSTTKRSAFRIVRESELLGGKFAAYNSREHIILQAEFLREDLPYYVELLGEVLSKTRFADYELPEAIAPLIKIDAIHASENSQFMATDVAHGVAFRKGVGNPILADPETLPPLDAIRAYSQQEYSKRNMAIIASSVDHAEVTSLVNDAFSDVASGWKENAAEKSKYFGGESRAKSRHGNSLVLGFEGSSITSKTAPEHDVLAHVLDGMNHTKWNIGSNPLAQAAGNTAFGARALARHFGYTDTGLFTITITGPPSAIRPTAESAVKAVRNVAGGVKADDLKRGIAKAKYALLSSAEQRAIVAERVGLQLLADGSAVSFNEIASALDSVTADKIAKAAAKLLDGRASVAAIGQLQYLPYADEIGLKT